MPEWYDRSWNPLFGCSGSFPGCVNCRARRTLVSQSRPTSPQMNRKALGVPLGRGLVYNVCSLGDVFSPVHTSAQRDLVFKRMAYFGFNTYVIQTRYPSVASAYLRGRHPALPRELWIGVSVENQQTAEKSLPLLKGLHKNTFITAEPLIGEIRLAPELIGGAKWLIVGCEVGGGRRPTRLEWVRSLVGDAEAAGIPVWVESLELNGEVVTNPALFPEDLRRRQTPFAKMPRAGRHYLDLPSRYIERKPTDGGDPAFVLCAPVSVYCYFCRGGFCAVRPLELSVPGAGDGGSYTPSHVLGEYAWWVCDWHDRLLASGVPVEEAGRVFPDGLYVRFEIYDIEESALPVRIRSPLARDYINMLLRLIGER